MAQSYTRQSSFSDGDTITAALFNNEYNQLVNAFTYSSSSASSTGHRHDGTAGHGGNIHTIGDLDFLNKIVADSTNNRWGIFVQVSSSAVEQIRIQDGAIVPVTDNDIDLGTSSVEFKDAYFDGTVTTDALVADTADINGGTVDGAIIGGSSAAAITGTAITGTSFVIGSADISEAELETIDGVTAGTVAASKAVVVDSNKDAASFRNITLTGELDAATLDISGDADIDGTTNLDVVDIDGAVDMATTLTVAGNVDFNGDLDVDGTTNLDVVDIDGAVDMATTLAVAGNVDFNGDLDVDGTTNLDVVDIDGAVDMASTLAVAGVLTGASLDISGDIDIDGTSNLDIVDIDGAVDMATTLTVGGEITAASLDISGNVDIDGTLETDALTIDGTTLAETISDTVGAMVGSNTETGITVTYEDGDNTLDFAIGTLNQDTTGTADNITVSANNSTDETVYPVFVDGATGSQGAESDTGLNYNPSTGMLTTTGVTATFTGNITGNVTGNTSGTAATVTGAAQSNITSLGTLTTLTVDNVIVNGTTIGHTSDTDLITLADGNVTIAGELDLTTLDVSGDADIDGTLEADAITIGGTTLAEFISDTAGAMFSSNTETGITATYQDADNTIDLVVGTLNQDTTGTASKVTVSDSTANTNFPVVFHDESNALLDDTGALRYNPSTGELLVPKLTVAGTTTTADTVTMQASNAIIFEGATADSNETTLSIVDPTSDHTQYLINQGGYIPVLAAATTTAITSTPAELNILDGVTSTAAELNILDGVTSTAAELNILDGATVVVGEINALDLGSTAVGTAIASKAVILDSNKDYTGLRNLTITGELDAATLDISGDVDIDGTLETDNLTVGGAQGSDGQVLTSTGSGVAWENASSGAVSAINNATANELVTIGSTTTELDAEANLVFDGTNLGIGTASPSTNLHIYSTADNAPHLLLENFQNADTDDAPVIELYTNDQTTGGIGDDTDVGVIRFTGDEKDGGTKETYAEIRGVAHDPGQGASNKGNLSFFVQAAGDLNETLTLDENMVGIGTASPGSYNSNARNLVIRDSGNMGITLSSGASSDCFIGFSNGEDTGIHGLIQYDHNSDAMHFRTNDVDSRVVIDSAGSVGISNTIGSFHSSVLPLIVGSGSGDEGMAIFSGSSNKGKLGFADAASDDSGSYRGYFQYDHSGDNLNIGTAGSEVMRIDSAGRLAIGVTSPEGRIDVNEDTAGVWTGVFHNEASGGAGVLIKSTGDTGSENVLDVRNGTGTIFKITQAGANVNIGNGDIADPTLKIHSATGGDPRIAFDTGAANRDSFIDFLNEGTQAGGIQYAHNGNSMRFSVASNNRTESLRITSTGQLLLGATAAVDSEQALINRNGSCKMTVRAEEDSSARDALFSLHTRNTGAQCRINFVDGSGAGTGAGQIYYNHDGNSLRFLTDSTEHFIIDGSGNLTATDTSIGSISDKRLKTNIQDYTYSIDNFKSYTPRIFDWINPEEHANRSQQIGFIAQEQEVIDPRFIEEEETSSERKDTKLLDTITKEDGDVVGISKTSKFGQKDAMYISVIQQLITRLETAEEKIAALENN